MARITIFTISVIISVFLLSTFTATGNGVAGGREEIKDVKTNKEVQELGRYSVEEYNRLQGSQKGSAGDLKFSKVVKGQQQVVAGMKYYLTIEAISKSGGLKVFDAELVVVPWKHSKQLLNFKPSPVN